MLVSKRIFPLCSFSLVHPSFSLSHAIPLIPKRDKREYHTKSSSSSSSSSSSTVGWIGIEGVRRWGWTGYATRVQDHAMQTADKISTTQSSLSPATFLSLLDSISADICSVADTAEAVRNLHPEGQWVAQAEQAYQIISNVIIRLNTDAKLYKSFKDCVFNTPGAFQSLSKEHQDFAMQIDSEFQDYGIQFNDREREEIGNLWNDVYIAANQYRIEAENEHGPVNIPQSIIKQVNSSSPLYRATKRMDIGDCANIWQRSSNPTARQALYEYVVGGQWNGTGAGRGMDALDNLIKARHKLATKLGFQSYSHMVLREKLVKSPETVDNFLKQYHKSILPQAQKELEVLLALKSREEGHSTAIYTYEKPYYSMKAVGSADAYDEIDEQFSSYLSLSNCIDGLNIISQQVFGLSLVSVPLKPNEGYCSDMFKMAVVSEGEKKPIGYIYFDLFEREGKVQTNANFALSLRHKKHQLDSDTTNQDGEYTTPSVILSTSFSPYGLTFVNLETLFHEFGHTLHIMLNKSEFQHTAGFRGPTDFTEFPSNLMQRYAYEGRIVQMFAKNSAGKAMPLDLHKRAMHVHNQCSALDDLRRLYINMVDQQMHSGAGVDIREVSKRTFSEFMLLQPSPSGLFECPATVRHFSTYAGTYYSYLYTEMLSAVTWNRMFKENPLSRTAGRLFAQKVLAPGTKRDQASVIVDLLGEFPSPTDLQPSL